MRLGSDRQPSKNVRSPALFYRHETLCTRRTQQKHCHITELLSAVLGKLLFKSNLLQLLVTFFQK